MRYVLITLAALCITPCSSMAQHGHAMNGRWHAIKTITAGKLDTSKNAMSTVLELHDGTYRVFMSGKLIDNGTFKVDAHSRPTKVDIFPAHAPAGGPALLGLTEMRGDHFVECIAMPGKPRPKHITSTKEEPNILIEYERAGPQRRHHMAMGHLPMRSASAL